MKILAFVPGPSTGWCWLDTSRTNLIVETGELALGCPTDLGELVALFIRQPDLVAAEELVPTSQIDWDRLDHARSDGIVRAGFSLFCGGAKWVRFSSESIKEIKVPELLQGHATKSPRIRDALKHAIRFLPPKE